MLELLNQIISLEEKGDVEFIYYKYASLYAAYPEAYDVWKNYYCFLWTAIEDASSAFHETVDLRNLLGRMLQEGKTKFTNLADFNFIAGYTVSIFPYEYGEYEMLEAEAQEMLLKAKQIEPHNKIYKLFYLRGIPNVHPQDYRVAEREAAPLVLDVFKGPGILNNYFRQILSSLNPPAYR
jgi:hypothetical protein